MIPKLTTKAACRVVEIDRDRFNEHVAAGRFRCAPDTVPGRARLFDPNDMIALWLFKDLMDDGYEAWKAGVVACKVAEAARANPDSATISYVYDFNLPRGGRAFPSADVPASNSWQERTFSGSVIRAVTTFNIAELRRIISERTDAERSIIGEDD